MPQKIKVSKPAPGYQKKTACVLSGKYSGVLAELFCVLQSKQPYSTHLMIDVLNSGWEKVILIPSLGFKSYFLFGIQLLFSPSNQWKEY